MVFPQPGWATISLIGMCASVAVCLLLFGWMYFCYFPGGRKYSDVIAVHEISKYNLSGKAVEGDEDYDLESQSEYATTNSGGPSRDQRLARDAFVEELPVRRGPQMMEI